MPGNGWRSQTHGGWGPDECGLVAEPVGREPLAGTPGPNERGRYYLYLRQNGLWPKEVGGWNPVTERANFEPWSPVRNVTRDYPPTLLLHGDADTDVPFAQPEAMAAELVRRGVEHALVRIKDGPHGFEGRSAGGGGVRQSHRVPEAAAPVNDSPDQS